MSLPIRGRGAFRAACTAACALALLAACDDSPAAPREDVDSTPRATMSTPDAEYGARIIVTGSGLYMTGATSGDLDGENAGQHDVFVRRYHPEGDFIWGRQFGTPLADTPSDIVADDPGSVYVVGTTSGSLAGSRGDNDAFIRKYDVLGSVLWTRQFGTAAGDAGKGVALGPDGSVYVVGQTFGALAGPNPGDGYAFLRRYTADGEVLWTRQFGPVNEGTEASAVAVDDSGTAYVAGSTSGDMRGPNAGSLDVFVRAFSADGTPRWTRQAGGQLFEQVNDIAIDGIGRLIVVGFTISEMFGPHNGSQDAFVWRLNRKGGELGGDQFGTIDHDQAQSVTVDQNNGFYVSGFTEGDLVTANPQPYDIIVRKYSSAGTPIWTRQVNAANEEARGITTLSSDAIFITGYTTGLLGPHHSGDIDAFVRRLDQQGNTVWTDQ